MRGSIYYQISVLVGAIFQAGAKKSDRVDSGHRDYRSVASYQTMQSYKKIWTDLGFFAKEVYEIRDLQRLDANHVYAFLQEKTASGISHQYLQKLVSAIGKLQTALERLNVSFGCRYTYDFACRLSLLRQARNENLTDRSIRNRAYAEPQKVVDALKGSYRTAASIQLQGGARAEGVCLIREDQLLGYREDEITGCTVGVILTKEKGGKVGEVLVKKQTYDQLAIDIDELGTFCIDYTRYAEAIREACSRLNIVCHGSHGLRWNYAWHRMVALQKAGNSYAEALQIVSYAMKHNRPNITCHYIGG